MPRVSVLVNTYNHERFIAQALRSVAEQDFPATEIETIIVDDGSTDATSEIAKRSLPRVRYIYKTNGGQVSAFHVGVAEARGDIIAFLDGDDWWTKDKLTQVVSAFDSHPDIAAVGHGYFEVDECGSIRARLVPETGARLSLESIAEARLSAPLRIFLGTSRLAVRRPVLERALPVPPELPFFDNFVFTQAIAISGALLLQQPLCYYRLHSGNLYASQSADLNRLKLRYQLLCGLLEHLPGRLGSLGIPDEVVSALLDLDRVEADRLALLVQGGSPWETFRVERAEFRLAYQNPDVGYRLFKGFALLLTLLMPPRVFYRLREWYSAHNLQRFRERIGRAASTVPEAVRRVREKS